MIYNISYQDAQKIVDLFKGQEETLIRSYLEGRLGQAWVSDGQIKSRCEAMFILIATYVLMSILMFWLAWLIGKRKKVNLIAGYVPGKYDDEKLACTSGIAIIVMGIIWLVTAFLFGIFGEERVLIIGAINAALTIFIAVDTAFIVARTCKK